MEIINKLKKEKETECDTCGCQRYDWCKGYNKALDDVKEQLLLHNVVGQREQLFCYACQAWTEHKDETEKSFRCTMCGNMKAK